MTVAVSKAAEDGARGGHLRLDREHGRVRGGLCGARRDPGRRADARRGRRRPARSPRRGCSGARVLEVRGDFDEALAAAQELGRRGTHVLVNSVNPYRRAGQKTAVFEIVEELGAAPDAFVIPYGGGGNTSAYAAGIGELGLATPIYSVEAEHRPTTLASAIRIGDPVHAESVRASGATRRDRLRRGDRRGLARSSRPSKGSSASRRRRPGSQPSAAAPSQGERLVVTITGPRAQGHGERRPLRPAARAGRCRPRRDRRRSSRRMTIVPRPGDIGQHRCRLRHRRGRLRPLERARGDGRLRRRRSRARAPASFPRTSPTSPSAPTRCSADPAGKRFRFVNRIPLERGLGSSAAAIALGLVAAAPSATRGGAARASGSTLEPHADNLAAALLGGAHARPGTGGSRGSPRRCRSPRSPSIPQGAHLDRELAHDAARDGRRTPRRRQRGPGGAARRRRRERRRRRSSPPRSSDWLHEPYRPSRVARRDPRHAHRAGCGGATLSGSGPTVIAWASDARCRARPTSGRASRTTRCSSSTVAPRGAL